MEVGEKYREASRDRPSYDQYGLIAVELKVWLPTQVAAQTEDVNNVEQTEVVATEVAADSAASNRFSPGQLYATP